MKRGSKQQKRARGDAGAGAAAAAAPAPARPQLAAVPPAAAPGQQNVALPDEAAWRLLLDQLWAQPEQQLVCRLLCCSAAMARLVHEVCAGRAVVRMGRQPAEGWASWPVAQRVAAYGERYSRWLAKHARLLARLQLDIWDAQLQRVTAGLRAAAGLAAPELAHRRTTRSQAAITATANAAAAAAAAAAAVSGGQQEAQLLPLSSLAVTAKAAKRQRLDLAPLLLHHSLAACPQLTRLRIECWPLLWEEQQQLAAAIGALSQLRELDVKIMKIAHYTTTLAVVAPPQLTKLLLSNVSLPVEAFVRLPPSMRHLSYMPPPEHPAKHSLGCISHLTRLTALSCWTLDTVESLPASLEELCVGRDDYNAGMAPPRCMAHLSRLRRLQFHCLCATLPELQQLVSALGPSLTGLDLGVRELGRALLTQRVTGHLPLTGLNVSCEHLAGSTVPHLGQWTGLRVLKLTGAHKLEMPQLADQLRQLTALQVLTLGYLHLVAPEHVAQPLLDCIVGMPSLTDLTWNGNITSEQAAALRALTRLTRLNLW